MRAGGTVPLSSSRQCCRSCKTIKNYYILYLKYFFKTANQLSFKYLIILRNAIYLNFDENRLLFLTLSKKLFKTLCFKYFITKANKIKYSNIFDILNKEINKIKIYKTFCKYILK